MWGMCSTEHSLFSWNILSTPFFELLSCTFLIFSLSNWLLVFTWLSFFLSLLLLIGSRFPFHINFTVFSFTWFNYLSEGGYGSSGFTCEQDEYSELVKQIKNSGIVKDHHGFLRTYKNTFKGKDAAVWLITTKQVGKCGKCSRDLFCCQNLALWWSWSKHFHRSDGISWYTI